MEFRSIAPLSAGNFGDRRRGTERRDATRAAAVAPPPADDGLVDLDGRAMAAGRGDLPLPDAGVQLAVELSGTAAQTPAAEPRPGAAAGHPDLRDLRGKLTDETV